MNLRDALTTARERASFTLWKARTVVRVSMQTGLHADIRWRGARVLLRDLPRGKGNPSLLFRFRAENDPHRIALIDPRSLLAGAGADRDAGAAEDRLFSCFEMNDTMDRIGRSLSRLGVGPDAGALLMLKNRPEFLLIQPAIGRIGGAAVSASFRSTAPELAYLARHSGARALLFDADVAEVVREAAEGPGLGGILREHMFAVGGRVEGFGHLDELTAEPGRGPDQSESASVVMYTSGTTGKPKGAVRTFSKDTMAATLAFIGETPMKAGEIHLAVCPLYHATAFGFVGLSYMLGGTAVVLREFRPELFLAAIERYRITSTAVVPTMLHRVLELGAERIRSYDTSSLRAIFSGGAPLPAALAREVLNTLGDKLYNFYGATETGIVTVAGPDDLRASPGTIGRVIPGADVQLLGEDGAPCAEGEVGELYARSPLLVTGYHNDPDATSQSMRGGYFSVGDLARRDRRGCYHIEGRKRDMIISGGVNVYPAEVEAALHDHPAIADAAVVGVPDREWGERVRAFVVRRPGAQVGEDDLKAHCRALLARPKVPRDIVFLDALPRNPTGKVLKRELVLIPMSEPAASADPAPTTGEE